MTTLIPTTSFRPLRRSEQRLYQARPSKGEPYLSYSDSDGFACYVRIATVRDMAAYGRQAGQREIIGHLGGRRCRDSEGDYVIVQRAVLNAHASGSAGAVVADCESQLRAQDDFLVRCRGLDCVGWFHTHLDGCGLFYSRTDRANQATWTHRDAIGIVLHPHVGDEGLKVFRGPESTELTRIGGGAHLLRLQREILGERPLAARRTPEQPAPADTRSAEERVVVVHAPNTMLTALCLIVCALTLVVVSLSMGRLQTAPHGASSRPEWLHPVSAGRHQVPSDAVGEPASTLIPLGTEEPDESGSQSRDNGPVPLPEPEADDIE